MKVQKSKKANDAVGEAVQQIGRETQAHAAKLLRPKTSTVKAASPAPKRG